MGTGVYFYDWEKNLSYSCRISFLCYICIVVVGWNMIFYAKWRISCQIFYKFCLTDWRSFTFFLHLMASHVFFETCIKLLLSYFLELDELILSFIVRFSHNIFFILSQLHLFLYFFDLFAPALLCFYIFVTKSGILYVTLNQLLSQFSIRLYSMLVYVFSFSPAIERVLESVD